MVKIYRVRTWCHSNASAAHESSCSASSLAALSSSADNCTAIQGELRFSTTQETRTLTMGCSSRVRSSFVDGEATLSPSTAQLDAMLFQKILSGMHHSTCLPPNTLTLTSAEVGKPYVCIKSGFYADKSQRRFEST